MKNEILLIIEDSKYKEEGELKINEKLLLKKLMEYIDDVALINYNKGVTVRERYDDDFDFYQEDMEG